MKRNWVLPVLGLVAVGVYVAYQIVTISGDPGHYYEYRHSHEGFVYPTDSVIQSVSVVGAEILLLALTIGRSKKVARACFLAAALLFFVFMGTLVFAMHSPPYVGFVILSNLYVSGWLLLSGLLVAIFGATTRHSLPRAVIASNRNDVDR